jgi:Archaeal/vacuolar-type H+-ATPase subunit E
MGPDLSVTLESLIDEVVKEALAEYEARIEEARKRILSELEAEKESVMQELRRGLEAVRREVEAERRRRLSQVEAEVRREYLDTLEALVKRAVSNAVDRIRSIKESQTYRDFLRRSIEEAVEALGSEEVVVETCSEDLKAVKSIASELSKERNVKVKVSSKTIDVIGGVKVSRADGTMVYDATIDYRLSRLSDQLRTVVVKHLVADDR